VAITRSDKLELNTKTDKHKKKGKKGKQNYKDDSDDDDIGLLNKKCEDDIEETYDAEYAIIQQRLNEIQKNVLG